MTEKKEPYRGANYRRQRSQELKAGFAVPEFPETSKVDIKHIAYLHAYCRLEPHLIASRYPKLVTLADVHLALAHYFRDPEAIDAQIKRELKFNARDGLTSAMTLPSIGLRTLAEMLAQEV
jgi:hypothetical protein